MHSSTEIKVSEDCELAVVAVVVATYLKRGHQRHRVLLLSSLIWSNVHCDTSSKEMHNDDD